MMHTLALTGDVNLGKVTDTSKPFALVAGTLGQADVVFGNLEGLLYDSKQKIAYKPGWYYSGVEPAPALREGGFHAVGCANNLNYGAEAIVSTLALLDEMGVAHTGAGVNPASAHAPAVLERDGVRFGFLQYTSVYWPIGHEAAEDSPGVAAVKAHTSYQPHPRIPEMPGGPPTVITWPDPAYLKRFQEDIRALRGDVDVVIVSCHWGITDSDETAQYQVALAHAAVDAGADVVMGHGPHKIQGVEVYNGKPIFYSLGNFFFGVARNRDWVGLMAWVELENGEASRVSCSPVRPNAEGQPTIRTVDEEPDAMGALEHLSQRFDTPLDLSGDKVVVWQRN